MALQHDHERVRGRAALPEQMAAAGPEYRRSIARAQAQGRYAERPEGWFSALQRHPALLVGGLALGALCLLSARSKGFFAGAGRRQESPRPGRRLGQTGPAGRPEVGLSSGLQPGGTLPGRSPAVGMGSIGTGGGSTSSDATGVAGRVL